MTELPYVLQLFLTFSRKKSQLDAVPAHFFFDFFETVVYLEGRQCAPPPYAAGAGHDIADFGVILGRFFFDQKSTFFNFDFDKTWFGGGLDPLAVEFFLRSFFFPLGRCNGAGKK